MVRFILEPIVGVVVAAIITAVVMVSMVYFGPLADPPGSRLWWLAAPGLVLASWRCWTRLLGALITEKLGLGIAGEPSPLRVDAQPGKTLARVLRGDDSTWRAPRSERAGHPQAGRRPG